MSDRVVYTREAARAGISVIGLSIANKGGTPVVAGKVRLFDETLLLTEDTVHADLTAAETKLVGYPAGGYPLPNFSTPANAPLGGAVITSDLINVAWASGLAVKIGGYWVEDEATPTPAVRYAVVYDPIRSLGQVGDGWPIVVQMGYGANVVPAG
jgi:hypothetical protein